MMEGSGQGFGNGPRISFPLRWDSTLSSEVLLFAHLEPGKAHSWKELLAIPDALLSSGELGKPPSLSGN